MWFMGQLDSLTRQLLMFPQAALVQTAGETAYLGRLTSHQTTCSGCTCGSLLLLLLLLLLPC
jgi:hypothetical protein